MTFTENPYYYPEKCGLTIFDSIDTAGSYEFDIFCIWEDNNHNLWWDSDSGCSCPTPFDPDDRHDLKPITSTTLYNFEQALRNHPRITREEADKIYRNVKAYVTTKNV